jgi:hypothetical protein
MKNNTLILLAIGGFAVFMFYKHAQANSNNSLADAYNKLIGPLSDFEKTLTSKVNNIKSGQVNQDSITDMENQAMITSDAAHAFGNTSDSIFSPDAPTGSHLSGPTQEQFDAGQLSDQSTVNLGPDYNDTLDWGPAYSIDENGNPVYN